MLYQLQPQLEQYHIIGKPVHQAQTLKIPFLQLQRRFIHQLLDLQLQRFLEELLKAPMEVKYVKSIVILFRSQ